MRHWKIFCFSQFSSPLEISGGANVSLVYPRPASATHRGGESREGLPNTFCGAKSYRVWHNLELEDWITSEYSNFLVKVFSMVRI